MKCPMKKWQVVVPEHLLPLADEDRMVTFLKCIKSECAWWLDKQQQCAIKALAKQLPASVNDALAVYGEVNEK